MEMLCIPGSGDNSRILFPKLVSAFQGAVTNIAIHRRTMPVEWKRSLLFKCPNLKRLSLSIWNTSKCISLREILSVHNGSLEFLEVRGPCLCKTEIDAIAKYGTGLKSLSFKVRCFCSHMTAVWTSVGQSLEEVSISVSLNFAEFEFLSLQQNSKVLRKIHIENLRVGFHHHGDLESLCIGLGDRLECLTLKNCGLSSSRLGRIATGCKEVRMDITEESGCLSSDLVQIGSRASSVKIGPRTLTDSGPQHALLQQASERCSNLSDIAICSSIPECAFQALMTHPKQLLKIFKASICSRDEHLVHIMLEALATKTSSLEIFDLDGPLFHFPNLSPLVSSNCSLRIISLRDCLGINRCSTIDVENSWARGFACLENALHWNWSSVINVLLRCKHINEISLSCVRLHDKCDVAGTAEQCFFARSRNVAVNICGSQCS